MGFNNITLLVFPLGLLLPLATVAYMVYASTKKKIAFDTVFYGIGAFLGSIVAVAIAFLIINSAMTATFSADNYESGFGLVGTIFSILIAVLFLFCESFKMVTIKHFSDGDKKSHLPFLGFGAGVVIAQAAVFFVALNIMQDITILFSLFTGAFIFVTGIMYYVLSYASEKALLLGSKGAAYGLSSIYYLMWISMILSIRVPKLVVGVAVAFFVFSIVIGVIFIRRSGKVGR